MWVCARPALSRAAGDPVREGGTLGDDRQNRPPGYPRHRPVAAHGLVPPGSPQVAAGPGSAGTDHARKQLQAEMRDSELSLRGLLRGFGLKVGEISKGRFAARVRTLTTGHQMLAKIAE